MTDLARLRLIPGAPVMHKDRRVVICHLADMEHVLVRASIGGAVERVPIRELVPLPAVNPPIAPPDLLSIPDEDWHEAEERFKAIEPLIGLPGRTKALVAEHATKIGKDTTTLYRWLRDWEEEGTLTALMRKRRSDAGNKRLDDAIESIIEDEINTSFLAIQRKTPKEIADEVRKRCTRAGLQPPHANTVRNRIADLSDRHVVATRLGRKAARKFDPKVGSFPGADAPLSIVLIDHTKADIILVDDQHRLPIGRPTLTLAIDAFSRMIVGFNVALEPPGTLTAAMALAHAILPKDRWLAENGISGQWPCWGKPSTIHLDNAKEFRGVTLRRGCQQHGIGVEYRRRGSPEWGGIIERAIGTLMKKTHTLPGTTFSNIAERGDYPSEAMSALTLREFEKWLGTFIVGVYNVSLHSGIGAVPLKRWEEGILGTTKRPGTGLPERIIDEHRLWLDFLPIEERTVQEYGILIDNIYYYADVLRPWIHARDPKDPKAKRNFIVRRDPRDISVIHFWDPDLETYFEVPYRDRSHPAISVWELREIERRLKEQGLHDINEAAIFNALDQLRTIEQEAVTKSKKARRRTQQRADSKRTPASKPPAPVTSKAPLEEIATPPPPINIQPFDDLGDMS